VVPNRVGEEIKRRASKRAYVTWSMKTRA